LYGIRLSRDEKVLYFISASHGLSMIDLETRNVKHLVSYFKNQFLYALNSIETHPLDPNVLYFDQSMHGIPMEIFNKEIFLNRPNGRLFKYSIK
jgi:hypothetical protein